jgi:hypothetical protein
MKHKKGKQEREGNKEKTDNKMKQKETKTIK